MKEFWEGYRFGQKILGFLGTVFASTGKTAKSRKSKPADKEVTDLISHVTTVYSETEHLSQIDIFYVAAKASMDAAGNNNLPLDNQLTQSMMDCVLKYIEYEGLTGVSPDIFIPDTHAEKAELKKELRKKLELYSNDEEVYTVFINFLTTIFYEIFRDLPKSCITDISEDAEPVDQYKRATFDTHILNLFDDVYALVQNIFVEFFNEDLTDTKLFDKTRDIFIVNGQLAAGLNPSDSANYGKQFPMPTEYRRTPPDEVIEKFFRLTPFTNIFLQKLPFHIPKEIRFEHAHILAGSGHGKTQLLQKLILDDLNSNTGFCVIDSQGDLISKLLLNNRLSPEDNPDIADKLVLIDASDVEYPTSLNLFALNSDDVELDFKQKEILANNTVDLYTYIFSSLLGADLTARQGTMFVYIAKLMMEIPNASIQTLRQLMEDGEQFRPYMNKLDGSAKAFFQTQFNSSSFKQVKSQILYRLWAVLSNSVLERMFSGTENKVNLYDAMNEGKIVLINTSKQVLGKIGSEVMGKFFIAMLTQSALKRAAITKEDDRRGFHIYVDEAQEYVDDMFNQLINQVRKYKCGFHLFHQNLDQLPSSVRASVLASTSVKLTGGISSKDAKTMAGEMKTTSDRLMEVKKYDGSHAEFSLYLQNVTDSAVTIDVPFGLLEKEPVMSSVCFERLIDSNRKKYCRHISKVQISEPIAIQNEPVVEEAVDFQETRTSEPLKEFEGSKPTVSEIIEQVESANHKETKLEDVSEPAIKGRGGTKHKYIQSLIQKLAIEKGLQAEIEHILPNMDRVDVAIFGKKKIAVEISVTTSVKHEVSNIQKCLDGFDSVLVISDSETHLNNIQNAVITEISTDDHCKINYLTPDGFIDYLESIAQAQTTTKTVNGFKVKVSKKQLTSEQQKERKEAIASVIASSIKKV
ncbi:MAG: type IV secretory system conjugative DNA transfer family protein [Arenicella sp.]